MVCALGVPLARKSTDGQRLIPVHRLSVFIGHNIDTSKLPSNWHALHFCKAHSVGMHFQPALATFDATQVAGSK